MRKKIILHIELSDLIELAKIVKHSKSSTEQKKYFDKLNAVVQNEIYKQQP